MVGLKVLSLNWETLPYNYTGIYVYSEENCPQFVFINLSVLRPVFGYCVSEATVLTSIWISIV